MRDLKLDDKDLGRGLRFSTCVPQGCRVPAPLPTGATDAQSPTLRRRKYVNVPPHSTTRTRPKTIAATPSTSRKLIGSSNNHPPSIGVIAKASATKG
jgi:hypothetical protein